MSSLAAQLAEADDRKAARRLAGRALGDRRRERPLERSFGQSGKLGHDPLERQRAGKVADRQRQSVAATLPAQRRRQLPAFALGPGRGERRLEVAGGEPGGDLREAIELQPQEGRMRPRPLESAVYPSAGLCVVHGTAAVRGPFRPRNG